MIECAAIGSHRSASTGLVLLITIWQACFIGNYKLPGCVLLKTSLPCNRITHVVLCSEIGYLMALDWAFVRMIAVVNVITDTIIAKIVR